MMVKTYITQSAWKIIFEEVNHFASQGNLEAIVYPLFGFVRSPECMKAPWEMLEIEDLDAFVVTHAHAPLRKYCRHTGFRAQFAFANSEEKEEWRNDLNLWSKPLCSDFLSLEIGNVHSHPFSRFWTHPSSGSSQTDYPRIHGLWEHMRNRKVNTPLEIILCKSNFKKTEWTACCFAFDKVQKVISLGKASIIPDDDALVKTVLTKPYYKTDEGLQWEQEQRGLIPGIESFDRHCFGWSTAKIRISEDVFLLVHLSTQFPNVTQVLVQTYDKSIGNWSEMKRFSTDRSYIELEKIILEYKEGGERNEQA